MTPNPMRGNRKGVVAIAELMIPLRARLRRAGMVRVGFRLLGLVAPYLTAARVASMGNRMLRWLRLEVRIGHQPWRRMDHGLALAVDGDGCLEVSPRG